MTNHGELHLKTLKGTGDQQGSSLVDREVYLQDIMIRNLLVSQHGLTTMMTPQVMFEMLDLFVDLCFQHLLKVPSQYRAVWVDTAQTLTVMTTGDGTPLK